MNEKKDIAYLVGAGKNAELDSVDFSDSKRPKTCLEVDFPILSVNQVAMIEGNAGKPIYQMSKWWARRRSSVFRALLIAAATKAPEDESQSAKLVWDNYYKNHQKNKQFGKIKVADIFMGGGTTLVEGSRLGMDMYGNDLNPVAWFVVKQQFADVDLKEVKGLLDEIEEKVRPQIIPFYYCDGPNGEKGKWTKNSTGETMDEKFDPLSLSPDEREEYSYEGPEIIYAFWAKHGPCSKTDCNHQTPLISDNVFAKKSLSVKYWEHTCESCNLIFDVEIGETRLAPDVPLIVESQSKPYTVLGNENNVICPNPDCEHQEQIRTPKLKSKKVNLALVLHSDWYSNDENQEGDQESPEKFQNDDIRTTLKWNINRTMKNKFVELRDDFPESITCPETGKIIHIGKMGGTIPKRSTFQCSKCGLMQDIRTSIQQTQRRGRVAGYAIQGFSPVRSDSTAQYNGRFFATFNKKVAEQYNAAILEWENRKTKDLANFWPKSEIPSGQMTVQAHNHGFTHWWNMFNPRQLLVLTQILKAIEELGKYDWHTREFVLGAFQQYLRNQNMFCFWDREYDKLVPHLSNNNYHPKSTMLENSVFPMLGRGNWRSAMESIIKGKSWAEDPWEIVSVESIKRQNFELPKQTKGKSEKVYPRDPLKKCSIVQESSTDLSNYESGIFDLIITDPPFGGLLHYSELSDFFHSWLRIPLEKVYPDIFKSENTPKSLEAVSNKVRTPEDPDGFYQRLLTECWKESNRILKPGGLLAFTFHHSEDAPWVAVLESLFNAGFYLSATYPIRSDETKGEGEFGSKTIEYDIIHVCRKRERDPTPISWAQLRKKVRSDVDQLQELLKNHEKEGLPAADLQVIRRGKALEYFSQHYGKVYFPDERLMNVEEALVEINQLIDENINREKVNPPEEAEHITRLFLKNFEGKSQLARDQLQKMLRGTGTTPDDYLDRGWVKEKKQVYSLIDPLTFAKKWHKKANRGLVFDLDQALFVIGACYKNSGINLADSLRKNCLKPHPALGALIEWISLYGQDKQMRDAAKKSHSIFTKWNEKNKVKVNAPKLEFSQRG